MAEKRYVILQCKNAHCKSFMIVPEILEQDRIPDVHKTEFDCDVCSTRMEQKGYVRHGTLTALLKDAETWAALERRPWDHEPGS